MGFFKFRVLGHEEAQIPVCTAVMDAKFSTFLRFPNALQGIGHVIGRALHLYFGPHVIYRKVRQKIHHQLPPRFDCCHASTLSLCSAPIAAAAQQSQDDSHPAQQCVHWRLGEFVVIHNCNSLRSDRRWDSDFMEVCRDEFHSIIPVPFLLLRFVPETMTMKQTDQLLWKRRSLTGTLHQVEKGSQCLDQIASFSRTPPISSPKQSQLVTFGYPSGQKVGKFCAIIGIMDARSGGRMKIMPFSGAWKPHTSRTKVCNTSFPFLGFPTTFWQGELMEMKGIS